MIFKQNMIVVITNGRLAGKKAVVIGQLDEQNLVVAGINRTPTKSEDYMPAWMTRRNSKFLTFIKKINMDHVLATRYKADIGLSKFEAASAVANLETKKTTNEEVNSIMKAAFEENKAKWLFTALKFNN